MSEKILEAFKEKKKFNILELMLKLQVDKNELEETLDALVSCGRLRIEEKYLSIKDHFPRYECLNSRSSIRGFPSDFYMLND